MGFQLQDTFQQQWDQNQNSNFANQVIFCESKSDPLTIYLPAYLSVKINNIESINIGQNVAMINLSLMFTIYFGKLNKNFVDQVCYKMKMGFSRDQEILLKKTNVQKQQDRNKVNIQIYDEDSDDQSAQQEQARIDEKDYNEKKGQKSFVIRKTFQANLTAYSFLTPFQIHDLVIGVQLRKIQISFKNKFNKNQNIEVKLNLMSVHNSKHYKNRFKFVDFSQMSNYAQYNLAQSLLGYENTLDRPKKNLASFFRQKQLFKILALGKNFGKKADNQNKLMTSSSNQPYYLRKFGGNQYKAALYYLQNKNVQYCDFHLPIYKKPITNFLTLYLPIWVLSAINLCLFYLRNDYGSRVSAVAALTLAFIPIIQTVKSQTPKVSNITFVQVVVVLQIIASFFFLVESIIIKQEHDYEFKPRNNMLFLLAVVITMWNFIIPLIFLGVFFIKQQSLNIDPDFIDFKFIRSQWCYNVEAHNFFRAKSLILKDQKFKQKALQKQQKLEEQAKKDQNKKNAKLKKINKNITKMIVETDAHDAQDYRSTVQRLNQLADLKYMSEDNQTN